MRELLIAMIPIGVLVTFGCTQQTQTLSTQIAPSKVPLELPESITELFSKFRECDRMDLVSLSPTPNTEGPKLCGWTILGSASIENSTLRLQLIDAVAKASLPPGAIVADCFEPRHALRIHTKEHEYDVIICFACNAVSVVTDGRLDEFIGFCILQDSKNYFNRMLAETGAK